VAHSAYKHLSVEVFDPNME